MPRLIDANKLKMYIDTCQFCEKCPDIAFMCQRSCEFPNILTPQWERAIDEQPTVDRWIPVSERLPAWGEKVLICNQHGEFALGRITQSDEGNVWNVGAWWVELKEYDAWMPLPEPYRGEE